TQWPAVGFDCPSGLDGDDPSNSPVDTTPSVQQASGACFLFHAFVRHLLTNVFADDIGPLGFSIDGNMVQAIKAMLFMLSGDAPATTFCNDLGGQTHTCKEQVITALDEAVQQISGSFGSDPTAWTWGRVHFIQPTPLVALVTTNFEPGPYARPGGAFTVDVGTPSGETSYGLTFQYVSGGNVRHISVMDPTSPVTKMQLPGPERDGPTGLLAGGGPADLLSQWVMNQYFDFAIGAQIDGVATSTQTFSAQ
ncbi:MAG TPA: penicillin acylase family protein, partial [Vicinamibacterales bacterium]|nr:penicillin acylase family protein [Vicinamibacterales bacterium]